MNNTDSTKILKVLLVEDSPSDARLLEEVLKESKTTKFEITRASRISEAKKCLEEIKFDIALLDLSLPDGCGIDTFRKIKGIKPNLPIVLLTGLDDETLAIQCVQEGAQDYLVKGQTNNKILLKSIRYAIERYNKTSKETERKDEIVKKQIEKYQITERDKEILYLIAKGESNEEIAEKLHLSISTIKSHIGKIFAKLHVSNRSQATAFVFESGLLK